MQLVSITVENYRSITSARKIKLSRMSILIGPNNEGKSNLLRALVAAMNMLTRLSRRFPPGADFTGKPLPVGPLGYDSYDWERDFPIGLQNKYPNGESVVILEFKLSSMENDEFRSVIGSNLNGNLPIRIAFGKHVKISVYKKGKGAKNLTAKSPQIAKFVAARLDFEYIRPHRTAASAEEIIGGMVEKELEKLEADPQFVAALKSIENIQEPVLMKLSEALKVTLAQFMKGIKSVTIQINSETRYRALRNAQIFVDDGSNTLLKHKGDGIQSLTALAIMRHASESSSVGKNLVVAVEEPESHLHPSAIHELHRVISDLSARHQVVVTTHCPLFVDRGNISSNIIVKDNKARPASSVVEIRDVLGVRASDNLRHAELVLLVEGGDDIVAIDALMRDCSPKLRQYLNDGTLVIDCLNGGSNLSYKASLLRNMFCLYHCLLDDDQAGHLAFDRAKAEGIFSDAEAHFCICRDQRESEFEDLLNASVYEPVLKNHYGLVINPRIGKGKKWSDRIKELFISQGKPWSDKTESELKLKVAEVVAISASTALIPERRGPIDALFQSLELRLSNLALSKRA